MKLTTEPSFAMRDFTISMMGHSAFQYLYSGLELGLFELLFGKPGRTRDDIADSLQLEDLPGRCLLFGLTALGLIRKYDEVYSNSVLIDDICRAGKLDFVKKVARFQALIVYPGQLDFLESLHLNSNVGLRRFRGEESHLYARLTDDPVLQKVFFEFMSAWSAEALPLLVDAVDFGSCRRLVDVGGGDGTIAVGLAEAYPHLRVQLLDSPRVCALAQERIASHGLTERVQVVSRDAFKGDFPTDSDCFLFAHFMVIWSPEENIALLKKAYEALPSGGRVVIFNSMASDEEDGPLFAALDSAYFMAVPAAGGLIYSRKDYTAWLEVAGFRETLNMLCESWWSPHGVVVGVKS